MGAFVSLLQRPPQETGFEAAAEGQNQALSAQAMMQAASIRKEQIAQAQLQTQEQQRAVADQDAFRKTYNQVFNDPTIRTTDAKLAKFRELAPQNGVNPAHVTELEKSTLANQTSFQKLEDDKQKQVDAHAKEFGIAAENLRLLPQEQRAPRWSGVIQDLHARGHLDDQQASQLLQHPIIDDAGLGEIASHAKTIGDFRAESQWKAGQAKRDVDLAEAKGKALQTTLQNAAGAMTAAAEKGEDEYARAYYALDPEVAKRFTHPKQYDAETTPHNATLAGELPNQRLLREQAESNAEATATYRKNIQDMEKRRVGIAEQTLALRGKETAAQKASALKDAKSRKMKLESQEVKLNKDRRGLIEWIKSGKQPTYASGAAKEPRDFQGELDDLDNTYEQLLREKYAVAEEIGEGAPKFSLEEAIKGLRNGRPGAFETKLTPDEEEKFQDWKTKNAPKDSGVDYDLRGAFKSGAQPAANGHWPDTFKKPNHPTFSNQSKYATADAPHWEGNKLVDKDGKVVADETPKGTAPTAATPKAATPAPAKPETPSKGATKTVKLPDGKYVTGTQEQLDAFMKKHNLTWQTKP